MQNWDEPTALDENYLIGWQNMLGCLDELVVLSDSREQDSVLIPRAEALFAKCQAINKEYQQCYSNYAIFYVRLAERRLLAGEDPRPFLAKASEKFADLRRLGGSYLDAEQHHALLYFLQASYHVQHKEDAAPALAELRTALDRCFALAKKDTLCRTLAAQAEWVEAAAPGLSGKSIRSSLQTALNKATLATESPEQHPDAWWVLAETHLRLARVPSVRSAARNHHINEGLAAAEHIFTSNPNHALGRQTQEALRSLKADLKFEPRS